MSNCRSGCVTQDHATWGACARAAGLRVNFAYSPSALAHNDTELDMYRSARKQGVQPDGTTRAKIEFAMQQSEAAGAGYGEDFNVIPKADGKGYEPVFKKDVAAAMDALPSDMKAIYDTAKSIPGSGVH